MMPESLSVIFPMFNEKHYICRTVAKNLDVLKDTTDDYEIIIVDDASSDGSERIVDELSSQTGCVKVVHHKTNRQLGGSLKTGFMAASKMNVLYSDMDMPFDLLEIKRALSILYEKDADMVSVYRLNRIGEGVKRCVYSVFYNILIMLLFGIKVKDINFYFKIIRADLLRRLDLRSEGSFIDAEMLIKAKRLKAKVIQFGTVYFSREGSYSRLSSLSVILKILREMFAFRFGLLT